MVKSKAPPKKAHKKAKKPARSSIMALTVSEGKEFVKEAERVLPRIAKRKAEERIRIAEILAANQPIKTKKIKRKSKPKAPRARPAPAAPAVARAGTHASQGVARAGSRASQAVARAGSRASQAVRRTGSAASQVIEQELHDRLHKHGANIGELNFSLRWWDPNDLDIHVICPCGTEIYFGNRKCQKCHGELDIDMNVFGNESLEPVEHIFFNKAKKGTYKFWVRYYSGPKTFGGVTGGN